VVARYEIPKALPEALLEGFEWDRQGRRYSDGIELNAYAARVAGSVGAMMACLMDSREPHLVARACDLGVAMQLTNIARDVGEDARAGRLYLPTSWLEQSGIDPDEWLGTPTFSEPIADVISRLLAAADELYARADSGIELLPRDCRMAIRAARLLYAQIGHELRRAGFDSISRRTVVPSKRKAALLARAITAPDAPSVKAFVAPLDQTRFLVEAVEPLAARLLEPETEPETPGPLDQRIAWVFNLFERLERRDRSPVGRAA